MSTDLFTLLPEGSRILFIRLRNLGEAVLDTANLRALKRLRPDLRIVTLVEALYTDLYIDDPQIEAIPLPRGSGDRRSTFSARMSVIREIRRRKFSAVVNLHGGPTSAQLTFLSGARHRVGASHFRNGYAYNMRIPPVDEILSEPGISSRLHTVETQFAWFKWLGLPFEKPGPTELIVPAAARDMANRIMLEAGIDPGRPYAVIAPTNEFYTKRWMPDRFAAIADAMIERGFQIVMTGAPTDEQRNQMAAVQAATSNPLAALSRLTIRDLVAVIAGSRLFVGNDSGPAHIASAVKTPQVVLFGPASSVRWRPWIPPGLSPGTAPAEVVQNHFECNPCHMYKCDVYDEPECIRSITVEQVSRAIENVLI